MRWDFGFGNKRAARGQTLVLFALMSFVLIAGLGLVIDSGVNYAQRRNMQNASDTASLSGTRLLSRSSMTGAGVNVWDANRGQIWDTIYATAIANGVPDDLTKMSCVYVDKTGTAIADCELPNIPANVAARLLDPPSAANGLSVRVSEEHTTFFMRAIGINTSGTAATSTAQAQIVTQMPNTDVLLAVCGVNTKLADGTTTQSILTVKNVDVLPLPPTPTPPATEQVVTTPTTQIDNTAYSYDWNDGNLSGATSGPSFLIYGANVATCKRKNWIGRADPTNTGGSGSNSVIEILPGGRPGDAGATPLLSNSLPNNALPGHTINGPLGCKSSADRTAANITSPPFSNCVMVLPIIDTNVTDPARGRAWGAFLVSQNTSTGDITGRLIRNYPLRGDTTSGTAWNDNRLTYVGPVSVTLVK